MAFAAVLASVKVASAPTTWSPEVSDSTALAVIKPSAVALAVVRAEISVVVVVDVVELAPLESGLDEVVSADSNGVVVAVESVANGGIICCSVDF